MGTSPEMLVGKRYGLLEVVEFSHKDNRSNNYFFCKCVCGTEKVVAQNHLLSGKTKSCGCLKRSPAVSASGLQKRIDDLRRHLDKGLKEIGSGAVYTILEVLDGYLSANVNVVNFQIIQVNK